MDYKKEYKKLKAGIEKAYLFAQTNSTKAVLEDILPELAESKSKSEDEKIRKTLIEYFNAYPKDYYGELKKSHILAWLEKQGKESSWKPSKEEMDVLYGLAYITNQYDEHKEEVITRLYQDLKREFFNGSSYENMFPTNTSTEDGVRRRSTIQVLEYARSLDTYNQYGKADIDKDIVAWLEKQQGGKDKFTQQHSLKEDSNVNDETNAPTEYGKYVDECLNEASKHFFSEGEDKYSVADLFYAGVRCGQSWLEKQGEKEYALKSSKDEDVHKFVQYIEKQAKAYELNLPNRSYDIYGFAKDILAWLEKQGEQKSYGQRQECIDCQFNYAGECKGSCILKNTEQKPDEWSEEDEKNWRRAIRATQVVYPVAADWLKSLKDRVQPRPKQEWSEEDETGWTNTMIMIKECASNHYTKDSIKLVTTWLKSIKQRIGG